MSMTGKTFPSLCWDCAKAVGSDECPWAFHSKPVDGWKAYKTKKARSGENDYSYLVIECPLFERDAVRGGLYRYKEGDLV